MADEITTKTIPTGTEAYCADAVCVVARGVLLTEDELVQALRSRICSIVWDDTGRADLGNLLASIATTSFQTEGIRRLLSRTTDPEDWRVGEALAEAFLVDHRKCTFPWPSGRDLKNPTASPTGTDLVGFQHSDEQTAFCRFAFGEVKTSGQEQWPPSVWSGRHGLLNQIEQLRDSREVKDDLLFYLGHHAPATPWEVHYKTAASRYLTDPADISLFGVLIRDVEHKAKDLASRAGILSANCPSATSIELRAV